jgi:predicted dehydrogenase
LVWQERGCIWQVTPRCRGISSRSGEFAAGTRESGHALARESQLAFVTDDYASLLARDDTDVVDICVPPALHHDFAIRAADAGKHIIMEKPLTGYFGAEGDPEPIGTRVPRSRMREGARNNAEAVREAVRRNGVKFCYAENWIYAPPIEKMRRLIGASKGSILELRAEENHSGSNSVFSRDWKSIEGGALLRTGVHSVGGMPALETMGGRGGKNHPSGARACGHSRPNSQQRRQASRGGGSEPVDQLRSGGCGELGFHGKTRNEGGLEPPK